MSKYRWLAPEFSFFTEEYHTVGGLAGGLALQPAVFFNALDGLMLASGLSLPQAPDVSLNALYVTHDGGISWQLSATVPGSVSIRLRKEWEWSPSGQ